MVCSSLRKEVARPKKEASVARLEAVQKELHRAVVLRLRLESHMQPHAALECSNTYSK